MERESEEDAITITRHLLVAEKQDEDYFAGGRDASTSVSQRGGSSVTAALVFSTTVAVCGSFAYGCWAGYISPVRSEIMSDLGLSTAEFSLFASLATLGGLLSSLVSGKISDWIGRRATMGFGQILCLSGWILIVFSQGAWSLDLGRLLQGGGVGLLLYVIPIYLAEIAPENLRGGSVVLNQLLISCGIATMFFAGNVIGWRILALIGMLPCLVQLLCLFFIPESPRHLARIGRDKEFEATLLCLRGGNVDITHELAEIKEYTAALQQIPKVNLSHLFQRKYAYALIVVFGLMALQQLGGSTGILFYASDIFESAGCSSAVGTTVMAIIQLPSCFVSVFFMDKFGRRLIGLSSAAGMCFSCILTALSFLLKGNQWLKEISPYLVLIGISGYSLAYPMGMGGLPYLMMAELLPINIKGLAGSLASSILWSTSWIVSYAFAFMLEWSSSGTFFIFAGVNAFLLLFIAKLVPETKGQSLEEIQESITISRPLSAF
ncbi:hypothetical protein Nepgr_015015 [Nepenthes gracilis]|uniref:Major facilitator superfamily (MFS) profile domain-containing protein n=1 Tax=Nepenthes gracilis TaxID=150966 RepID=A0AAD3SM66_NEPGR|nr:hypothetical protein Nepgr_015015 [Nepenthes gracilis]